VTLPPQLTIGFLVVTQRLASECLFQASENYDSL